MVWRRKKCLTLVVVRISIPETPNRWVLASVHGSLITSQLSLWYARIQGIRIMGKIRSLPALICFNLEAWDECLPYQWRRTAVWVDSQYVLIEEAFVYTAWARQGHLPRACSVQAVGGLNRIKVRWRLRRVEWKRWFLIILHLVPDCISWHMRNLWSPFQLSNPQVEFRTPMTCALNWK